LIPGRPFDIARPVAVAQAHIHARLRIR
jgi:hypothetical protein